MISQGPTGDLRRHLVSLACANGLLTQHTSTELGGLGLSHFAKAVVIEEAGYSNRGGPGDEQLRPR